MKKLLDLKKVLSDLELEQQGRGIIMEVTRPILLGSFYLVKWPVNPNILAASAVYVDQILTTHPPRVDKNRHLTCYLAFYKEESFFLETDLSFEICAPKKTMYFSRNVKCSQFLWLGKLKKKMQSKQTYYALLLATILIITLDLRI